MKKLVLLVPLVALSVFADTYDARLEFVDSTGVQYIDTGVVPNSRFTRAEARFLVLECPTSGAVGLLGTFADLGDGTGNILRGDTKNCALTIGKHGGNNRILPNWSCYPTWSGYYYDNYGSNFAYTVDFHCSWGTVDGYTCAYADGKGYKDADRKDEFLAATATMFLGDVNDSTGNPSTPSGSRLKARWYGFKLWNGDVLVGDFFPARKGSKVGFFDSVSKTFFESEEGDYVAPSYFNWSGQGDVSDLRDPANYVENAVPGPTGVIVVPADTEVCARYEDTAFLNSIGGVSLPSETSSFALTNGSWTSGEYVREYISGNVNDGVTFRCGIFGQGVFSNRESDNSKGSRYLYMCCDSGNFAGKIVVTNAAMRVLSQYALGGANSKVYYHAKSGTNAQDRRRMRIDPRMPMYFEFHAGRSDNFLMGEGVSLVGDIYLEDEGGNLTFYGNGNLFRLCGNVYTPFEKRVTLTMDAGACFDGPGEKWLGLHAVKLCSQNVNNASRKHHQIGARLHTARQPFNDINTSQMNFSVDYNTRLYFNLENALDATAYLMLRQGRTGTTATISQLDLNGYNQQLGILDSFTDPNSSSCDMPAFYDAGCCITSTAPASLTIYECCRNGRSSASGQSAYKSTFIGRVEGAVSIVLDSTNELCSSKLERAISFNAPGSGTTGGLYARNGTIRVWETASFPNLSVLEASGEGKLDIRSSAIGNGESLLVSCTNLVAGATAVLTLAEGVTLNAQRAFLGKRWLSAGTYGSAEAAAAQPGVKPHWALAGLGVMTVAEGAGVAGSVLILR